MASLAEVSNIQRQYEQDYIRQAHEALGLYQHLKEARSAAEREAHKEIRRSKELLDTSMTVKPPEMLDTERLRASVEQKLRSVEARADRVRRDLEDRLRALEARRPELENELASLTQQAAWDEVGPLSSQLKELLERERNLEGRLRLMDEQERGILDRLAEPGRRRDELLKQLKDAENAIQLGQQDLRQMETDLDRLRQRLADEEARRADAEVQQRQRLGGDPSMKRQEAVTTEQRAYALIEETRRLLEDRERLIQSLEDQRRQMMEELGRDLQSFQDLEAKRSQLINEQNKGNNVLESCDAEKRRIRDRRDQIRRQIEALEREDRDLDARVTEINRTEDATRVVMGTYPNGLKMLDQERNAKQEIISRLHTDLAYKASQVQEEVALADELKRKLREAENEDEEAKRLIQRLDEDMERYRTNVLLPLDNSIRQLRDQLDDKNGQFLQARARQEASQRERLSALEQSLQEVQATMRRAEEEQAGIRDQRRQLENDLARLRSDRMALERHVSEADDRRRLMTARIGHLQGQLGMLMTEVEGLRGTLGVLPNRVREEAGRLQILLMELDAQLRHMQDEWQHRSQPEFVEQLKRESEAIMRWKAAQVLESKQAEIVRETGQLAGVHVEDHIQLEVDEQARQLLLEKHLQRGPGASDVSISDAVVDMLVTHHIRSV